MEAAGSSRLAHTGLLVLFPGFFVYHALVDLGLPPVLGGYSVLAAALMVPVVLLAYTMSLRERGAVWMDIALALLLAWTLVAMGMAAGRNRAPAIVVSYAGAMIQWVALYGVARSLALGSPRLNRWCQISWWLMTLVSLSSLSLENLLQGTLGLGVLEDDESLANYQDFGLLYLIVTLLCIALSERAWFRWGVLVVSVAILFLNGARSEFAALVLGVFMLAVLRSRHPWLLVLAAVVAALGIWASTDALVALFPDNRIVALVESSYEYSATERQEMAEHAWNLVQTSPLAGDFGNYRPGEYAHSILSAWVDLGIGGLLLMLLMLGLPILDALRRVGGHAGAMSNHRRVMLVLLLLALLLLFVAKTHTYNLLPFALGLYANDAAQRLRPMPSAATA